VQWQFINVSGLYRLHSLIDGAELYSCIEEMPDADAYIEIVHKKAEGIIASDSHEILQLL
jgi:hypothetical protein